jgi:hypothetical protein
MLNGTEKNCLRAALNYLDDCHHDCCNFSPAVASRRAKYFEDFRVQTLNALGRTAT